MGRRGQGGGGEGRGGEGGVSEGEERMRWVLMSEDGGEGCAEVKRRMWCKESTSN